MPLHDCLPVGVCNPYRVLRHRRRIEVVNSDTIPQQGIRKVGGTSNLPHLYPVDEERNHGATTGCGDLEHMTVYVGGDMGIHNTTFIGTTPRACSGCPKMRCR